MKRAVWILLAALLVFLVWAPSPVALAATVTMFACRDATVIDHGAYGSEVRPASCGREFSASDPYLVLYRQIDRVDMDIDMVVDLTDPSGTTVLSRRFALRPRMAEGGTFTGVWVLPISAAPDQIPEKLRVFTVVRVAEPPARERPGEWTYKVALMPGPTATLKFTLKP